MGMAIRPRDAARFLVEFGFIASGGGCPRIKQTKARLVGRTWALLGVLELIPERPLPLLEFKNRVWS